MQYDKKLRTKMQRLYAAWSIINALLCIYILIVMIKFWDYLNKLDCIH